jgi:hypothetical protein
LGDKCSYEERISSVSTTPTPLPVATATPTDVGDVYSCLDELVALLEKLGYEVAPEPEGEGSFGYRVLSPGGRRAVFLGDLVDRGPKVVPVLQLVW